MRESEAVALFDGSPYVFSRTGRKRTAPRIAESCLTDDWTRATLRCVYSSLGGKTDLVDEDSMQMEVNGRAFRLSTAEGSGVTEQLGSLAGKAGLEFLQQGLLVLIGRRLEAMKQQPVASDLEILLGRNPFLIEASADGPADAVVTPSLTREGKTYEWAGFRATATPGTNADAWLKYDETWAVRTWVNASRYMDM